MDIAKEAGLTPQPLLKYGDSGEIRTLDNPLRRRMLYPAELPNHFYNIIIIRGMLMFVNYKFNNVDDQSTFDANNKI